ncbi:MAG: hypothetical protein AAF550_00350 [Myxococcota bacterium]
MDPGKAADAEAVELLRDSLSSGAGWSASMTEGSECYWSAIHLARLYGTDVLWGNLPPQLQDLIEQRLWEFCSAHSTLAEAQDSVLRFPLSENHNSHKRSTVLITLEGMARRGRLYGAESLLPDGHTVARHATAWQGYWERFFTVWGSRGLTTEAGAPYYEHLTLSGYLNLRDLSNEPRVRVFADKFLRILLADIAHEVLLPSGLRAGGATRMYPDTSLTRGSVNNLSNHTYLLGWQDRIGGPNDTAVILAMSDFVQPDSIRSIATSRSASFSYISGRLGRRGFGGSPPEMYALSEAEQHVRRSSWVTRSYVLGAYLFDQTLDYVAVVDQNRSASVMFAQDENSRVIVFGCGNRSDLSSATNCRIDGRAAIVGFAEPDILVAWKDVRAHRVESNSTRVFVSADVWSSVPRVDGVESSFQGWFVGETTDAFIGIRIAGPYEVETKILDSNEPIDNGVVLRVEDEWAPVVIRTAEKRELPTRLHFHDELERGSFTYSSEVLELSWFSAGIEHRARVFPGTVDEPVVDSRTLRTDIAVFESPFLNGPVDGVYSIEGPSGSDQVRIGALPSAESTAIASDQAWVASSF